MVAEAFLTVFWFVLIIISDNIYSLSIVLLLRFTTPFVANWTLFLNYMVDPAPIRFMWPPGYGFAPSFLQFQIVLYGPTVRRIRAVHQAYLQSA